MFLIITQLSHGLTKNELMSILLRFQRSQIFAEEGLGAVEVIEWTPNAEAFREFQMMEIVTSGRWKVQDVVSAVI